MFWFLIPALAAAATPPTTSPAVGDLRWVPGGRFTMGSAPGAPLHRSDEVRHRVRLTQGFLMMSTEVTRGMFRRLIAADAPPATDAPPSDDDLPVENVSWFDAAVFANAASKADGLPECYTVSADSVVWTHGCAGYRLPTEAEWERAARAGGADEYAGTNDASAVCSYANLADVSLDPVAPPFLCTDGAAGPTKVGNYRPNAYGLHDVSGNVWEWVWDGYGDYGRRAVSDPEGVASKRRVARGGGSQRDDAFGRVAHRGAWDAHLRADGLGFRLVRSVP